MRTEADEMKNWSCSGTAPLQTPATETSLLHLPFSHWTACVLWAEAVFLKCLLQGPAQHQL